MSACIVWMDSEEAKLFHLSASEIKKNTVKTHSGHQHEEQFFHEVATAIGPSEELLVFGPGLAKIHFKTHLEKHHHNQLIKHLIAVETLEKVSDRQILEKARPLLKKFELFNPEQFGH